MAHLISVNVGLPSEVQWRGKTVRTGIWKQPVSGRVAVKRLNIAGDGQGDLGGHGGEQRAVLVYQAASYRYWEKDRGWQPLAAGQFGENFTVDGLADDEVCIGDRYRIGTALFEVTQPRVTCYRLGIRLDEPQMPALLTSRGRPGFYFRVLEEGEVGAGDAIHLVSRGAPQVTVAEATALLYSSRHPHEMLERALQISALSPGWRWSFEALLKSQAEDPGASGNAGLAPAAVARAASPGFIQMVVTYVTAECEDVVSISLRPADRESVSTAVAGQFIVLRLPVGPGSTVLFRSYSLSGPPSDKEYRISIKLEQGGAAGAYVKSSIRPGDKIDASAPRGDFRLRSGNRPIALVSAGIGATPVLAMLHALAANGDQREIWWLHVTRNGATHCFAAEARRLVEHLAHGKNMVWYSQPAAQEQEGVNFDAIGRLGAERLRQAGVPRDSDFYVCGPAGFLSELQAGLRNWGVPPSALHSEVFAGGPALMPGVVNASERQPHEPDGPAGSGPKVSFARSGITVRWRDKDQSLLELAEACDIPVRWSCRAGVCHNCESGLVSGGVHYGPDPLDLPAAGNVLICCAQPQGDVVLDL
jgi:MOSC domain-containing protein YiiM/ferredoxin-NADP reductase